MPLDRRMNRLPSEIDGGKRNLLNISSESRRVKKMKKNC